MHAILLATKVLSKLPCIKDVYRLDLLYAKQVIVPSWKRRRQLMSQNILKNINVVDQTVDFGVMNVGPRFCVNHIPMIS